MSNNFMKEISPSVRIISSILLTLSLLLANSIYLIIFITILTVILILLKEDKVNTYVNLLKKCIILLLIILVAYIIVFGEYNIFNAVIFLFKIIIILILIKIFILELEFRDLHHGIYGILIPIKIFGINIEKISFKLVVSIYFIKFLFNFNENIEMSQVLSSKRKFNLKNNFFPMIINCVNQLETLQDNLKIQLYRLNYKKSNVCSRIIFLLVVFFFIVCIFKEVIM